MAQPGTPEARAVAAGFSDSLLATAPIASKPQPERKSVLIDANALLLADIPAATTYLERVYRQPYAFDAKNSRVRKAVGESPTTSPSRSARITRCRTWCCRRRRRPCRRCRRCRSRCRTCAACSSATTTTSRRCPRSRCTPRRADERIGYFTTDVLDFTSDIPRVPVSHYVNRWRLEKKDPARRAVRAEAADRVLDRPQHPGQVPRADPRRHPRVEQGVRADRLQGRDPGRGAARRRRFRHLRHPPCVGALATVAKTAYGAIGPSVVDPRTGEILDADIGIDANNIRVVRSLRGEYLPPRSTALAALAGAGAVPLRRALAERSCTTPTPRRRSAAFGLDVLEARGDIEPGQPRGRHVRATPILKAVTMHEVGHTLGLRHNFRASTIYTEARAYPTRCSPAKHGIAGLGDGIQPLEHRAQGRAAGRVRHVDARALRLLGDRVRLHASAARTKEGRAREDRRSLATSRCSPTRRDEESMVFGVDPDVNQFDLGSDPLAYAEEARSRSCANCGSAPKRLQARSRARATRCCGAISPAGSPGRAGRAATPPSTSAALPACATAPAAADSRSRRSTPAKAACRAEHARRRDPVGATASISRRRSCAI